MTGTSKPVRGHALWAMESIWSMPETFGQPWAEVGICQCGAAEIAKTKTAARAWHREHKAAVLAAREEQKP